MKKDAPRSDPTPPPPRVRGISLRCTHCRDALRSAEGIFCAACLAPHHADCFESHGRCSAPGCESRANVAPAATRARRPRLGASTLLLLVVTNALTAALALAPRAHALAPTEHFAKDAYAAQGQVVHLVPLRNNLESDLAELKRDYADALKVLKEGETVRAMLCEHGGIDIYNHVAGPPVPAIDARVLRVKEDVSPGLVLLSVGSNDKVEKGFHFSIYRGSEFVGKVIVEKVLADSCGCRVLFTKEGLSVAPGDEAATRLQ